MRHLYDLPNDPGDIEDLAEKYLYSKKLEQQLEHQEKYLTNYGVIPSQLELVSVRDRYRGRKARRRPACPEVDVEWLQLSVQEHVGMEHEYWKAAAPKERREQKLM